MRYQVCLFIVICVAVLFSINFPLNAQTASEGDTLTPPALSISNSPAYPYDAEITGNDVYIRSGPGSAYYPCGKLSKGEKVKIFGDMDGVWSKIQPPAGSFSWISAQYVKIDPTNQSIGIVTGDDVRVWAGSDRVRPEVSTSLQGKLGKGEKVKLLGEELNNYYKIAVPSLPDAYLWISTQYTKPIPLESPVISRAVIDPVKTIDPTKSISEQPVESNVVDSNESTPAVEDVIEISPLDEYYGLVKQIETEQTKTLNEQDYSAIKEELQELVNNKDAGKASRYAQVMIDRIEGIELALEVGKAVKQQNEELKQSNDKIEKAHLQKLSEIQNLGKYAAVGIFQNLLLGGSGTYRIVDDHDKNVCVAFPSEKASTRDFNSFIGKKVGLVGKIDSNNSLGAVVRFDEIVIIK